MQNSIWKLTALAGLVGIGFLVVLQAQRGMPKPGEEVTSGANPAGDPDAGDAGEKPGTQNPEVESALLFDQHEPAEFGPADPAADGHSQSVVGLDGSEATDHPLARSERGDGAEGSLDDAGHARAFDPATADEPGQLFVEDARPLNPADESTNASTVVTAGITPVPPATTNPFGADTEPVEVVIQPRTATADADDRAISPASAEFPAGSAGPSLFGPNGGADAADGTDDRVIEPIPDDGDLFGGDPAFDDGSGASANDTAGTPPFNGDAGSEYGDPRDALAADQPEPDAFEELPASEASGPSAMRLLPADDGDATELADDAGPDFDDLPTVAADPFPAESTDEASATAQSDSADTAEESDAPAPAGPAVAAPDVPDSASATDSVAGDSEPARLPDTDHAADPPGGNGSRIVPLASDDLRGDGTIGADGPRAAQQPQLTIEKKAPAIAVLGQPLVYSIVVRNAGSTPAHQVVVEDRIPKGSRLTGTIPRAELVQKKLVWKLGVLKPGEEQKIAVRIVPIEEGQIGSIATVNFVAEVAARTTITAPKLELSLQGPAEARLGQNVKFTFKLANTGDGLASGVYLRNIIPDALRHTAGNDLEYKVGDLKPGESREVSLTVTAVEEGSASNRALVTADGGITVDAAADIEISTTRLRLERSGPKRRFVGRDGEFTNTIINESAEPLAAIAVVETVPAGMQFVHASHGGRWDASSRTVTWTLPQLGPEARETLMVTLVGRSVGVQSSEVHVRSAEGDEARVDSETQVEGLAALDLKVADNGSPIGVGDTITLRIIAANRGSDTASNVRVSVTVPPEMEFVSAQGPGEHKQAAGSRIEFAPLAELKGRSQEEMLLVLKAVNAGSGDSRVEIAIDADQMARPLKREEAVYILPEADSP